MPAMHRHPERFEIGIPARIHVAARDRDAPSDEEFSESGHSSASDSDKVHWPRVRFAEETQRVVAHTGTGCGINGHGSLVETTGGSAMQEYVVQ